DLLAELVLELVVPVAPLPDARHLVAVPLAQQASRELRTDLAPTCDQHVHALLRDVLSQRRHLALPSGLQQAARRRVGSSASAPATSHPSSASRSATFDPTRPQPIPSAFTSSP